MEVSIPSVFILLPSLSVDGVCSCRMAPKTGFFDTIFSKSCTGKRRSVLNCKEKKSNLVKRKRPSQIF